jgi:hypothetical protein
MSWLGNIFLGVIKDLVYISCVILRRPRCKDLSEHQNEVALTGCWVDGGWLSVTNTVTDRTNRVQLRESDIFFLIK